MAANSDTTPLLGGAAAAPAPAPTSPEAAAAPVSPQQQQQQQGGYAAYSAYAPPQGKDGMGSASGNLYQQPPPGYPGYGTPPPGMQQYQQLPPGSGYATTTYTSYQPAPVVQIAPAGQTVYASVTTYGNLPIFRDVPVTITCRHCQVTGPTKVDFSAGLMTWLICGGVSLFGLICGCCLVPFFMDSTKDAIHTCSSCNQVVGTYKRM